MYKKIWSAVLCMIFVVMLVSGCSHSTSDLESGTEKVENEEIMKDTNSIDETKEAETKDNEQVAQQVENEADEEDQELEYIYDDSSIEEYMSSLDAKIPVIVIYNEEEGYKLKLKENQEYHLKYNDRIFLNNQSEVYSIAQDIPTSSDFVNYGMDTTEVIPDYAKFENPQQVYFGITLRENPDADMIWFGCKLVAPEE